MEKCLWLTNAGDSKKDKDSAKVTTTLRDKMQNKWVMSRDETWVGHLVELRMLMGLIELPIVETQ